MGPHLLRLALRAPLAARVPEVTASFFFLVSTEVTGCRSASAAVTLALIGELHGSIKRFACAS
jgi:hypothetical protein